MLLEWIGGKALSSFRLSHSLTVGASPPLAAALTSPLCPTAALPLLLLLLLFVTGSSKEAETEDVAEEAETKDVAEEAETEDVTDRESVCSVPTII
eukprot:COSAG05_NODE_1069_length_5970_cov_186.806166_3_plen_96_part_00